MRCDQFHELLSPYLDRELSSEKREEFERHVDTCPDCAALLAQVQEAQAAMSAWPEMEVSPSLEARLLKIAAPRKKKSLFNLDFFLRPSLQPVMAAFTIVLTLVSLFLLHPDREQLQQSLDRQFHIGVSKIERLFVQAESFTDFLASYKDNVVHSIKNINPKGENEKNGG
jgi:anti-sigma factor RsiW